jgi:hypothetical protein
MSANTTHTQNKFCRYDFLEVVHSTRLERLGEGLAVCSGETVAAHWVEEPVAKASASRSLDATPKSSITIYGMEDVVHASADEPYSGF